MRQAHERLGVQGVGETGRVGYVVRDAKAHPAHAGGVEVAQPGDLHRCRALREGGELRDSRVPAEIDQNVDAVGMDRVGDLRLRTSRHRPPRVGERRHLASEIVGAHRSRIAEHFEGGALVPLDERQAEERHHVIAEVARDITDAQAPLGIPGVAERTEAQRVGALEPRAELHVPAVEGLVRDAFAAIQREELRRLQVQIVGATRARRAIELERLRGAALGEQHAAEPAVCRGMPRFESDRAAQCALRFRHAHQGSEHAAVVVVRIGPVGPLLEQPLELAGRSGGLAALEQQVGKRAACFDTLRIDAQRALQGGLRIRQTTQRLQHRRVAEERGEVLRPLAQRCLELRRCKLQPSARFEHGREHDARLRELRSRAQRFVQQAFRPRKLAARVLQAADVIVGVGVRRVERERREHRAVGGPAPRLRSGSGREHGDEDEQESTHVRDLVVRGENACSSHVRAGVRGCQKRLQICHKDSR